MQTGQRGLSFHSAAPKKLVAHRAEGGKAAMLVEDSINAEGKYESEGVGSASLGGAYTSTHQTTMEGGGTAKDVSKTVIFTLESLE